LPGGDSQHTPVCSPPAIVHMDDNDALDPLFGVSVGVEDAFTADATFAIDCDTGLQLFLCDE
jgi:hypothetical protein